MRILIAEDEKDLNRLLKKRLEEHSYSVDACLDGEEALAFLEMTEYDAVILDIMMPKKDGLSVLRELRAKGSKVPVLLLTARSSVDDRVSGLDAGADDYLVKPFAFEELLARIRVMLRKIRLPATMSAGLLILQSAWILTGCSGAIRKSRSPARNLLCSVI